MIHKFKITVFVFIILIGIISKNCFAQTIKPIEIGIASYYGKKFNGRKTSSGERFNKDSLTGAHHSLPFGTIVRVINIKTNDTIVVRINDRIGHRRRIIDLSPAGAAKLKYKKRGTAKVRLEVIRLP